MRVPPVIPPAMIQSAALLLALAAPALAQPMRENTETRLNRQLEQDRFRDRARDARGEIVEGPDSTRVMRDDRRSLQPDVGRPEEEGRLEPGGVRGALTGGMNPQR
jgi:hypothetical protein